MTKTTFLATDAAGIVHKRTSENRTYTHTIVALPSYEFDLAQAQSKDSDKFHVKNFNYNAEVAAQGAAHPYYPKQYSRTDAEWAAEGARWIANHVASQKGCKTGAEFAELVRAEAIAAVEARKAAGYYGVWHNLGWCGRPDLAVKAGLKAQGPRYAKVAALPATVK